MVRTQTRWGIHSNCLSEFSRVGSRGGSIRLCFFWCWTFQLKNAFNHFKIKASLFRTDSTSLKAWKTSQSSTYLWDFMQTGCPQHSCSASDALVFRRKGVSPPSYPKSAPKIQKKKIWTWKHLTVDQDQYPLQLLESGMVLQNFKRQTQTRVFSKGEEKILHFWEWDFWYGCTVKKEWERRLFLITS